MRDLHRFEPERGHFLAWAHTIAHRHIIDRRRKRSRWGEPLPLPTSTAADLPDIDEVLTREQRLARLQMALDQVPVLQRRVLVMHHLSGRSIAEIAEVEGVPANTVKSRLHRGRALLSRMLRGER